MKLLGKDISGQALLKRVEDRLRARGLLETESRRIPEEGVAPRVEPLSFNVHMLEEHADATQPLPLHSHRTGVGRTVVFAKWAFRKTCQIFINEALSRQRLFNGHVRDSYAQLSAEVIALRKEVATLKKSQTTENTKVSVPSSKARARRKFGK